MIILGDVQLIQTRIWEMFLTIVGAFIGAVVADRVARAGELKRDFQRNKDDLEFVLNKWIDYIERETSLAHAWSCSLPEIETVMRRVRSHLSRQSRGEFDKLWKAYHDIDKSQLVPTRGQNEISGNICDSYDEPRQKLSEPLRQMLKIVNASAIRS